MNFLYEYVFNVIVKLPNKEPYEKQVTLKSDKGHNHAANQAKQTIMRKEKISDSDSKFVRVEFRSSQIKNYM